MNTEVRVMLNKMYDLFKNKFQNSIYAWDRFIEFLAIDNNAIYARQLDHNFEWLLKDIQFSVDLMNIYNPKLLRSDYYDHLGDMYVEIFLSKRGKRGLDQRSNKIEEYREQLENQAVSRQLKILDPAARTGRLLMSVYKTYPNSILFGVEPDIRLYRIALTNFAIFNIPGYVLNADGKIHELNLTSENGQHNWGYSNVWNPPTKKFKPTRSQ